MRGWEGGCVPGGGNEPQAPPPRANSLPHPPPLEPPQNGEPSIASSGASPSSSRLRFASG